MSNIILLAAVFLLIFDLSNSALSRTREVPVRSSRSLQQQVDSYTEMLLKEVEVAKNTKEKLRSVKRVLTHLRSLNPQADEKTSAEQSYLNRLVSSLDFLPKENKFRKKECSNLGSKFLARFEPESKEEPQDSALKISWTVLRSLCE